MDNDVGSPQRSPERAPARLLKTNSVKSDGLGSPVASLAPSDIASESGGIRKSFDRGLEKLKDRRRDSTDRDDAASSRSSSRRSGLSKLVPKRSLRRKKKKDGDGDSMLGVPKGSSKLQLQSHNASVDSLGIARSPASSLLTDDSEPDLPSSRPELASRASHKGFLTFTSPLIPVEVVESNRRPEPTTSTSESASRSRPVRKAVPDRPGSEQSSKPSIKVTSVTSDSRPETPTTFVTPPTPVLGGSSGHDRASSFNDAPLAQISRKPVATPKDSLTHRRVRSSTSASKKGSFSSPLTPTVEEAKTPGGSVIQPSGSSGFFAGFFSAAQNAATQISNSLTNPQTSTRSRSATSSSESKVRALAAETDGLGFASTSDGAEEKSLVPEPAIATLGQGNLSLTHLGITDHKSENGDMVTSTETMFGEAPRLGHNASASTEEASAADAVSAAYSNNEERSVPIATDPIPGRTRSLSSLPPVIGGDQTPPRSLINTLDNDAGSILRAGSVRSRLSGHRKRRHNSSVTGAGAGAIAAAVAASNGVIANPASKRPVGFQVANSRSNKEFHQLFKSVPEDDHLIDDYSAALQRDILLHGRFYVSERHICFASNILGWVTQLVISFDEVVGMEKKSTAMIFPNAIVIQTLHAKNVFASFLNRDPTYDLLVRIWKIGHPNIKTTETGHALDEHDAEAKAENADGSDEDDEEGSSDEDDDESDGHHEAASSLGRPASLLSEPADTHRQVSKASALANGTAATTNGSPGKSPDGGSPSAASGAQEFPGPASHAPTECADSDTHYDKQIQDAVIPAPLGKVYSLMFGPQSGSVMRKFLLDDQKSLDLQLEDDKKGMGEDVKSQSFSYIKPLTAPVGPKQTKCLVTSNLDAFDLEKAVSVTCSTSTPDVPSGNIFVVKTRYCLTWAAGNQTRLHMSATVEWSGKSWLRGPIEKGAGDGQIQYGKDLAAFLKTQVASRSPAKTGGKKGKGKKKKSSADADASPAVHKGPAKQEPSSWGPLQPLHDILSPIGSMAGDLVSPVSILSVLLLIVSILWLRGSGRTTGVDTVAVPGFAAHQRVAAYDQLFKREESQLWDWFEVRLDLESVRAASASKRDEQDETAIEGIPEIRMDERQVDDAIRTTEARLRQLKGMMGKQREQA